MQERNILGECQYEAWKIHENFKLTSGSNKCLPAKRGQPANDVRKKLALRTWRKLRDPICIGNVSSGTNAWSMNEMN